MPTRTTVVQALGGTVEHRADSPVERVWSVTHRRRALLAERSTTSGSACRSTRATAGGRDARRDTMAAGSAPDAVELSDEGRPFLERVRNDDDHEATTTCWPCPTSRARARSIATCSASRSTSSRPAGSLYEKDGCRIMAGECPDAIPPRDLGDHSYFAYLAVDDVDAYHARAVARGSEDHQVPARRALGHARVRPAHRRRPPDHDRQRARLTGRRFRSGSAPRPTGGCRSSGRAFSTMSGRSPSGSCSSLGWRNSALRRSSALITST